MKMEYWKSVENVFDKEEVLFWTCLGILKYFLVKPCATLEI